MSWSRGSELMESIVKSVNTYVTDDEIKLKIYKDIADAMWDMDCDTLDEAMGIDTVYTQALYEIGFLGDEDED